MCGEFKQYIDPKSLLHIIIWGGGIFLAHRLSDRFLVIDSGVLGILIRGCYNINNMINHKTI